MEDANRHNHESFRNAFLTAGNDRQRGICMQDRRAENLPRQNVGSIERRSMLECAPARVDKVILWQCYIGLTALWLGIFMTLFTPQAYPQNIRSKDEITAVLAIENLSTRDGVVAGEVRSKVKHELRDVQLFIRYTWLWDEERNPGKTDPGTSAYYTLKQTIPPGEKISFTYKPSPPLPKIAGGRFETSVTIAGFTEVIPQSQR